MIKSCDSRKSNPRTKAARCPLRSSKMTSRTKVSTASVQARIVSRMLTQRCNDIGNAKAWRREGKLTPRQRGRTANQNLGHQDVPRCKSEIRISKPETNPKPRVDAL